MCLVCAVASHFTCLIPPVVSTNQLENILSSHPFIHIPFSRPDENKSADLTTSAPALPHIPCTTSNLENYLHVSPVKGLHVVCVETIYLDGHGIEHPLGSDITSHERRLELSNSLRLTLYKGAHSRKLLRRVTINGTKYGEGGIGNIDWNELKIKLLLELELLPEQPTTQPWAVFSALGERIVGENDRVSSNEDVINKLASSEMVVVAEGGNWIWPGVHEGFRRTVELDPSASSKSQKQVTIETLSLRPLVVSVEGFLSDEECDYIAEIASPQVKYSSVSLKDADKGKDSSEWRTSQSAFLSARDDEVLTDIDHRVASLTRIPRNHQEYVQVLRYGAGEKYDSHHDYFDPSAYRSDKSTLRLIENGKKNRYATVFWYLTDVHDGGETIFPRYGGAPAPRSHKDCSLGLKVKPQKGKVIIFYSLDASGEMDPFSLHGACPVGENNLKWAANKWIWNAPMPYVSDE